jgi:hypothetical protein
MYPATFFLLALINIAAIYDNIIANQATNIQQINNMQLTVRKQF